MFSEEVMEVTKEELKDFPIQGYGGEIHIYSEEAEIPQTCINDILNSPIVGVDTETKPSFKKGVMHPVSLIQVATENAVYLFRLKVMGIPAFLVEMFNSSKIIKAGIAIGGDVNDLRKLNRSVLPLAMVDLNTEAEKRGFLSIGAKKLSALCLGFTVSKRHQVSNWAATELSNGQITYAATDAWICLEIYKKLFGNV
jgi:ribonuclease D